MGNVKAATMSRSSGLRYRRLLLKLSGEALMGKAAYGIDVPVVQHEWFREVMEEPDPARKLQLNARNSAAAKTRIGGLFRVIRGAAEIDADCSELWRLIQSDFHANQQAIVEGIVEVFLTHVEREHGGDDRQARHDTG